MDKLISQLYSLGFMILIEFINGILPFFNNFNVYGNMALILAHKAIEYFLYFGLKDRGLYIINL